MRGISQTEFESLRQALLNTYNSQTTNHVGYLVALVVGLFVLISSKYFIKFYRSHKLWSLVSLSMIVSLGEFFVLRIIFWSFMSTMVLTVTENQALSCASKYNTTVIMGIQYCLRDYLTNTVHGVSSTFYQLGQAFWFGPFILLFALTFLSIYIFLGFWSGYYYAKSRKWLFDYSKSRLWLFHYAKSWKAIGSFMLKILGIILIVIIVLYCYYGSFSFLLHTFL